ncbi:hypothetical protein OG921_11520 [Aldersonia sp. NBC_00410]|uniref:Rv1157c family protein n=1 Tax=Aldersonia sp. NBC_00410 TaxID=2975954 RepID=UPI00225A2D22|nr:hypothetical protein [Aldersonia sp. NBC_00410]MCX5043794.1 hypothetical protein [Aldersonia sp. NBC_00410]
MHRTREMRRAAVAVALTACATLGTATAAVAAPAQPAPAPTAVPGLPLDVAALFHPAVQAGVPVDALAALAPAIIGAVVGPADSKEPTAPTDAAALSKPHEVAAGDPQEQLLAQARTLIENAPLPPEIKSTLERVITFLDGSGGGGPEIPKNGPVIAQFLYPTVGQDCISGGGDSIGAALAVPGPAALPPPGPKEHQTGFVFTALGTAVPAATQAKPLTVTWLNLDTRKTATQDLTDKAQINHPDGPATLSTVADTGAGRVIAVVSGSLTTQAEGEAPLTCEFLPTIGLFTVA